MAGCATAAKEAAVDASVSARSPTAWCGTSANASARGLSAAISRPRYRPNGSARTISPPRATAAAWASAVFPDAVGPASARTRGAGLGLGGDEVARDGRAELHARERR